MFSEIIDWLIDWLINPKNVQWNFVTGIFVSLINPFARILFVLTHLKTSICNKLNNTVYGLKRVFTYVFFLFHVNGLTFPGALRGIQNDQLCAASRNNGTQTIICGIEKVHIIDIELLVYILLTRHPTWVSETKFPELANPELAAYRKQLDILARGFI